MKTTAAYTSTLPVDLLEQLSNYSEKLNLPKNKIIERSLREFIEKLKRLEYIQSFQKASNDPELSELAEMGLEDYLKSLEEL